MVEKNEAWSIAFWLPENQGYLDLELPVSWIYKCLQKQSQVEPE